MWFSVHPTYLLASALAVVRASLDFCSSDSREWTISRREEVRECSSSRSLQVWRGQEKEGEGGREGGRKRGREEEREEGREREGGRHLGVRIRHVVVAAW